MPDRRDALPGGAGLVAASVLANGPVAARPAGLIRADGINRACERVQHKDVRYRFVIDMTGSQRRG